MYCTIPVAKTMALISLSASLFSHMQIFGFLMQRLNFVAVIIVYLSGPSCSKLTTSLVNVSLKFQKLILQIHCYFLLKKCENPLHCKGFSHFFNKK